MNRLLKTACLAISSGLVLFGCASGGSSQSTDLGAGATPFTTSELYQYLAEKTQIRKGGGVFYTGLGTLISLEGGKRFEGTWGSYDGGVLCLHFEDREDRPCETYLHDGSAVAVVSGDSKMKAPKMLKGDQLTLLETGNSRQLYSKSQTTQLISGKTHAWENNNGAYYDPSGKLDTVWDGVKESGKWSVTDKGALCWHIPSWGKSPCESYFMGPDGLVSVYKGKEGLADELRDGNVLGSL